MRPNPNTPRAILHLDATCFSLKPITLAELTSRINSYSVKDTIRPLARVGCLLTNGKHNHSDQAWAINQLLSPDLLARSNVDLRSDRWVYITRRQLHLTYQLLATFGDNTEHHSARSLLEPPDRFAFGELLLHVSSLFADRQDIPQDHASTIQDINPFKHPTHAAVQLLRTSKSDQPISKDIELIRSSRLLFHYLPTAYQRRGKSFETLIASYFEQARCEPTDLWRLGAAILLANYHQTSHTLDSQPGITRSEFFKNFDWPDDKIERTLRGLTTTLEGLQTAYTKESQQLPQHINSKPLLHIDGVDLVLDFTSLACYLGSGIFGSISDCLHVSERDTYRDCFGDSLEAYVRDLADAAARHSNCGSEVKPMEEDHPGHDFQIIDGHVVSAIEVKADFIRSSYLIADSSLEYSNSIRTSKTFTKAPEQLAKTASALISQNPSPSRLHLGVVAFDDAFSFLCVQQEFDDRFREKVKRLDSKPGSRIASDLKSMLFRRPFVVGLREWEYICLLVASGKRFVDCFDAVVSHDAIGEYPARMSLDWKNYIVTTVSDGFMGQALDEVVDIVGSILRDP